MARDEYIRIYRSTVEGTVPSLTSGEIATNLADGKLFIGGSNGDLITYPQNPVDANSLSGSIESLSVHSGNVFLSLPIRINLIKHSQDYVTSGFDLWNSYGSVSTVTNLGNATDSGWPNGSTGGISLVFAANDNNGIYQKIPDIVKNQVYTVSCWARSSSGTEKARFSYYDGTLNRSIFSPDYTLTTTPQRVSFTFRAQSNNTASNIAFGNGSGSVGGTVLAWGFQLEQGWIATNPIHNDTGAPKQSSAQVIPVSSSTGVTSFNGLTGTVTLTGDGSALFGYANNRIGARLGSHTLTGVASFDSQYFGIGTSGHLVLTGAYQVTGDTVVAGSAINIGTGKVINNIGVTSFNGLTGTVTLTGDSGALQGKANNRLTVRMVTDNAVTGVASFDATHFTVATTGHVRSKGVMTINGQAPNSNGDFTVAAATVVTGDGGAIQGKSDAFITARLATTGVTGVASFDSGDFDVSITGHVTVKSGGIGNGQLVNSSITFRDSIQNTEVASLGDTFTLTGGPGISVREVTTDTFAFQGITATDSVLGVASFSNTYFSVSNGAVSLASTYQVTGDTIQAGYGINIGTGKFINNTGVTSFNGLTGNVSLTGDGAAVQGKENNRITVRVISDNSMTGVASFDVAHFTVATTGHVRSKGVMTINSQAPDANGNFTVAAATVVTGDGGAIEGKGNAFITARLASESITGVASFNDVHFTVNEFGAVSLLYDPTNVAKTNTSNVFTSKQYFTAGISADNIQVGRGLTYTQIGYRQFDVEDETRYSIIETNDTKGLYLASNSGTASTAVLNPNGIFLGHNGVGGFAQVSIGLADALGLAIAQSNYNSRLVLSSYNTINGTTTHRIASATSLSTAQGTYDLYLPAQSGIFALTRNLVASLNGLTGSVTLTGDGQAVQGKSNNTITARLATDSLTGVASFSNTYFSVSNGAVSLASAYQVTGDTVQAGSFINIGAGKTINNIGVQSFNGLTGARTLTGDGQAILGKENNTITARLATDSLTGVASFSNTYFSVSNGAVSLASAYQVTGDTIQAGSAINIGTGKVINNIGVTSFNGATGTINFTVPIAGATSGVTGTASFNRNRFQVSLTGNVDLLAAYQVTGDTIQAGYGINIGAGKVINNRGVTAFNGLTGNVSLTGDGQAILGKENNAITARVATACGITGVLGIGCGSGIIVDPNTGLISGIDSGNPCSSCSTLNEVDCGNNASCSWCPSDNTCKCVGQTCLGGWGLISFSGIGISSGTGGQINGLYFDAGSLTFNSATTLDPTNDFVVFYDASHTGLVKTKRIKAERILLDNDTIFNSKSTQFVKSKTSSNIEFEILTAVVTPGEEKLLKSGDAYTYITQNTVKSLNGQTGDVAVVGSLNGCTGTITITGTANEVVVTNSCPTITIGLPDNVSIPYLSGTGATFTQTVTATRFIGIVSGGDF